MDGFSKEIALWAYHTFKLIQSLTETGIKKEIVEGYLKLAYTIISLSDEEVDILSSLIDEGI